MPTHGYQGNCSSEVIDVSDMLYSKIRSTMANNSALESLIDSCYVFRIKSICNRTFVTSHVCLSTSLSILLLTYSMLTDAPVLRLTQFIFNTNGLHSL